MNVPDDLEERLNRLEKRADEKLPGDYTIRTNFFTDGDTHLVAVHNITEDHRVLLHEDAEKPRRGGSIILGGVKVPASMGGVIYD